MGLYHLYQPPERETPKERETREWTAKLTCIDCPVTKTCIKLGLQAENVPPAYATFSIWGGMDRTELLLLAKRAVAERRKGHSPVRVGTGLWECKCGHPLGKTGKNGAAYRAAQKQHIKALA